MHREKLTMGRQMRFNYNQKFRKVAGYKEIICPLRYEKALAEKYSNERKKAIEPSEIVLSLVSLHFRTVPLFDSHNVATFSPGSRFPYRS